MSGFFARLKQGLTKTRGQMTDRIDELTQATQVIDEDFYEELTDILLLSDAGMAATDKMITALKQEVAAQKIKDAKQAKEVLKQIMVEEMNIPRPALNWPMVMLVVGVNGVGKTTTVGKLALRFKEIGRSVTLAAADTFRAAADDQLQVWADRAQVPLIKQQHGADPAAVVFDAITSAKARNTDLLIVDTAGRLHNKKNLMNELSKISRVLEKTYGAAHRHTYLVLDATTGQNAIAQAREFSQVTQLTGLILTKVDGTAKGGVICAICDELKLPVVFLGVGEGMEDLQPFDAEAFAANLLE